MVKYDLVFEGGGARGWIFNGALDVLLAERSDEFGRLVGTSAGAVTALLLAAGLTPKEILLATTEEVDGKPRFATFMDVPGAFPESVIRESLSYRLLDSVTFPFEPPAFRSWLDKELIRGLMTSSHYRKLFSFVERGGMYAGDAFVQWIEQELGKRGFRDSTFAQFYATTGVDLSMVATDTSAEERRVLNHRTTPDCPVVWGARMSMSIPFVWQEVVWRKEWGLYLGQELTNHVMVDGGVLSNFAIDLFLDPEANAREMGPPQSDAAVLGFMIDETLEVPNAPAPEPKGTSGENLRFHVIERGLRIIETMQSALSNRFIDAYPDRVCRLPARGYGSTEFDMPKAKLDALIAAGASFTRRYLQSTDVAAKK